MFELFRSEPSTKQINNIYICIFMFISFCFYNVNIISQRKVSWKRPFSNGEHRLFWEWTSRARVLAIISQQAHACWELRNWSLPTWLVCEHFIQIYCMGIYLFRSMYMNHYEHLMHKLFGTFYRDTVLYELRPAYLIIISHEFFHNSHELHP